MKKYIGFMLIPFLLSGCYMPKLYTIYPVKALLGIDFTPFTEKGFLFTPEKYTGQYEAIGLINYETIPGAQYEFFPESPNPQYIPGGTHQTTT